MPTISPTTVSGLAYNSNQAMTNYTSGLNVMTASGMIPQTTSTASATTSPAYLLGGNIAQLAQQALTGPSSNAATNSPVVPNLPIDSSFSILNEAENLTPDELQTFSALVNGQTLPSFTSSSSATQQTGTSASSGIQSASATTAPVNFLGDPIQWQVGDIQLYALDPSLAAVVGGATSSVVTASPQAMQAGQSLGGLVDMTA